MHNNILVGITGKVASGKSFVTQYCYSKGYKIFNSDDVVHNLYRESKLQKKILDLVELKSMNRAKIAEIIFADEDKRHKLEGLIHPLVTKELQIFAKDLSGGEIGFAEVPLLFEAKMEDAFDYIILVHCDRKVRLKRAAERGTFQNKFEMIDKVQMDDEKKKKLADFMIDSNVSKEVLGQKIDEIIEVINERNNTGY